ncbi:MAG: hypothetical protein FWD43_04045 [Coriobacteriia bacterium]|nr:hypothetical protein [Coriobacteriia bacterium]
MNGIIYKGAHATKSRLSFSKVKKYVLILLAVLLIAGIFPVYSLVAFADDPLGPDDSLDQTDPTEDSYVVTIKTGIGSNDSDRVYADVPAGTLLGEIAGFSSASPAAKSPGWKFAGWDAPMNLAMEINDDVTIEALWEPVVHAEIIQPDKKEMHYYFEDLKVVITHSGTGKNMVFHYVAYLNGTQVDKGDADVQDPGTGLNKLTVHTIDYTITISLYIQGNEFDGIGSSSDTKPSYSVAFVPGLYGDFAPTTYSGLLDGSNMPAAPEPIAQSGWKFSGWKNVTTGEIVAPDEALPSYVTGDVTYEAQWVENVFVVTFDILNGTWADGTSATITATFASGGIFPDAPEGMIPLAAYSNCTGAWNVALAEWPAAVAEDATYTFSYDVINTYTVSFTPGTQGAFEPVLFADIEHGSPTPAAPAITGNAGYAFTGWSPAFAGTVTNNAIYVAQWVVVPPTTAGYIVNHRNASTDELLVIETQTGTIGTTATAEPQTIENFTYDADFAGTLLSGAIEADGSLVLTLYYTPVVTIPLDETPPAPPVVPPTTPPFETLTTPPPVDLVDTDTLTTPPPVELVDYSTPTTQHPAELVDYNIATTNFTEWALANLILAVLGIFAAIVMLIAFISRRKQEEITEDDYLLAENDYIRAEQKLRKRMVWCTASVIVGVIAIVFFILTEDITAPMTLVDSWTIWQVAVFAIQIAFTVLALNGKKEDVETYIDTVSFSELY